MLKVIVFMLFFSAFNFVTVAEAALADVAKDIGIVIIGDNSFKTEKYFNIAQEIVKPSNENLSIKVGDEIQSKYNQYCSEKGFNAFDTPELKDLNEFAEQNGFDRVLYLIVEKPVKDEFTLWDGRFVVRISLQVNAYLCDKTDLIKTYSVGKKKESEFNALLRSPEVRAQVGAFKLCAKEIGKAMKGLW